MEAESLRKVKWIDQELKKPLVEIKEIPNENIGRKVSEAKDCLLVNKNQPQHRRSSSNGVSTPDKVYSMLDVTVKVLHWNVNWLEEQKKLTVSVFFDFVFLPKDLQFPVW